MDDKITIPVTLGLSQAILLYEMLSQQFMFDTYSGRLETGEGLIQAKELIEIERFISEKLCCTTKAGWKERGKRWRSEKFEACLAMNRVRMIVDEDTRRYHDRWNGVANNVVHLLPMS